jgi:hypothetical protein
VVILLLIMMDLFKLSLFIIIFKLWFSILCKRHRMIHIFVNHLN